MTFDDVAGVDEAKEELKEVVVRCNQRFFSLFLFLPLLAPSPACVHYAHALLRIQRLPSRIVVCGGLGEAVVVYAVTGGRDV